MKIVNIKKAFAQREVKYIGIASTFTMLIIFTYFTDYELIKGNFGYFYAISQVTIQVLISFLFGLNVSLLYYKMKFFSSFGMSGGGTAIGGFISLLVSGCPTCSITLASYLGLATFFSSFPFAGLELKVIGLLILLWSVNDLAKNLTVCKISR